MDCTYFAYNTVKNCLNDNVVLTYFYIEKMQLTAN